MHGNEHRGSQAETPQIEGTLKECNVTRIEARGHDKSASAKELQRTRDGVRDTLSEPDRQNQGEP